MRNKNAAQSTKMKRKTESTLPAALEAWGIIGMASPVKDIEEKQTDKQSQKSQSQKHQSPQIRLFIIQVHKIKEHKAGLDGG